MDKLEFYSKIRLDTLLKSATLLGFFSWKLKEIHDGDHPKPTQTHWRKIERTNKKWKKDIYRNHSGITLAELERAEVIKRRVIKSRRRRIEKGPLLDVAWDPPSFFVTSTTQMICLQNVPIGILIMGQGHVIIAGLI